MQIGSVWPVLCQIRVRFSHAELAFQPSSLRALRDFLRVRQGQVAPCHETATRSEPLGIGANNATGGRRNRPLPQADRPGHAASRCDGRFHAPSCAIILGAGRPSARRASPEDDSADDGRMNQPRTCRPPHGRPECRWAANLPAQLSSSLSRKRNLVSESCRPSPLPRRWGRPPQVRERRFLQTAMCLCRLA